MKAKLIRGMTFQTTPEMYEQITNLAERNELSLGEVIRQLITMSLKSMNKEATES